MFVLNNTTKTLFLSCIVSFSLKMADENIIAYQRLNIKSDKHKKYKIMITTTGTTIILIITLICGIFLHNKNEKNIDNNYTGFQSVLPQTEICFDPNNSSTYEYYVHYYNEIIKPYEQSKIEGKTVDCLEVIPKADERCHFADTWLNNCKKTNLWGFGGSRPCILLTLNVSKLNFIPEPYAFNADLHREFQVDYEDEEDMRLINSTIVVHCSHAIEYDPFPGFIKNFAFNTNNTNFLSPLIGVWFDLDGIEDTDYLDVECILWSNTTIRHPFPSVKFKIGKNC